MEAKQTLFEFLEDQLPSYENPLGVQIYLNTDSTLVLCSNLPGVEQPDNESIELFQEVKSLKKLVSLLKISKLEQLLKLSPDNLLALYERGRMNIICMLDGDHELRFLKYKKCIWARNDNKEIHKVEVQLSKAEDFINYTRQYYSTERAKSLPPQQAPYYTNHSLIFK